MMRFFCPVISLSSEMTDMNANHAIAADLPRWGLMWLLAAGLFFAGKAAMVRGAALPGGRLWGFSLGWAGMDPSPFRMAPAMRPLHLPRALGWPMVNLAAGCWLLWFVARQFAHPLATGWIGMTGLILTLHFGLFALLAVAWRAAGVPVVPIMRSPAAATTLAEFWGRRWNLAFRDLAHRMVFKPVCRRMGQTAALWAVFVVSGLAHELVISVPTGGGYGRPTLYFLIQALGITLERTVAVPGRTRRMPAPFPGWLWTHAFTVLPLILLFHPPFVERVMVPFFRFIGALP